MQSLPAQPCVLCGAASHAGAWCGACDAALPVLPEARCPICALPTPDATPCGRCLRKHPLYNRTVAAFAYSFPVDKLVQALKFNAHLHLAPAFAARLARQLGTLPDCVVAMPLHPARLAERGHNQSLEIARPLAAALQLPLLPHACVRLRDTPPQSSLKWKARSKNLRGAFRCEADVAGLHVAMVDDVMTSGASLNELALALRRAGAREISAWVAAKTLPHAGA